MVVETAIRVHRPMLVTCDLDLLTPTLMFSGTHRGTSLCQVWKS